MYAYVSNQINRKYKSYWAYQFLPNLILANDEQIFKRRSIESQFLPIFCSNFWLTIFQIWCKLLKSIFLMILHNFSIWHFCIKICDFFQIYKSTTMKCNVNTRKKKTWEKVKSENFFCEISMEEFQSNLKHISFIRWIESTLCIIQKAGLDCWGYLSMILSKILMKFSMLSAIEIKFWQL